MDLVGAILGAVVCNEHAWTVKPVVMGSPRANRSCPGEVDAIKTGGFPALTLDIRQRNRQSLYIQVDQLFEKSPLVRTHR